MISNAEKIKDLPVWKKCVKLIHQILVPLFWLPALVCTLLCCFKPAEGSNSRIICIIIAASCYLIIFGIKYLNKRFTNKEMAYRTFQNTTVKNLDLPNLIPLLALTVVIALPFYLLFVTSLKNPSEANAFQFNWWPKEGIDLDSYKEVFTANNAMGVTMGQAVSSVVYLYSDSYYPGEYTFTSSNPSIVGVAESSSVYNASNGSYKVTVVSGRKAGRATITAKPTDGSSKTVKLTVMVK